jgi:hypothetical protein
LTFFAHENYSFFSSFLRSQKWNNLQKILARAKEEEEEEEKTTAALRLFAHDVAKVVFILLGF